MSAKTCVKESIAIIGLGKAGTAMGHLLRQAGYPVVAVAGRSVSLLRERVRYTGGQVFSADRIAEAAKLATLIFITTPDDVIAGVCGEIAQQGGFQPGDKVIHLSGAGGLDLLAPARQAGARVACIHPIQSFADVEGAIRNTPGSTFGITAEAGLREWAADLVRTLGGIPFDVPEASKPLYHAAACMASNYLTTLIHMVEETYLALGLSREQAVAAFWPLVGSTLQNIEAGGPAKALTGPISRGDAGTVEQHLQVLKTTMPGYLPAYRAMGLLTVDLAVRKGSLAPERAETLRKLLSPY